MKKLFMLLLVWLPLAVIAQHTITLTHTRYTTTFDEDLLYPVLVHWKVKATDICFKGDPRRVERTDNFKKDPLLPQYTNLQHFYTSNPGHYQRGHNMDAADNSCDPNEMNECFYFSNMTPQTSELNEDTWGDLEDYTRHVARQYGEVEIWCGSYGVADHMGSVSVPAFCWKILKYQNNGNTIIEAYLFPNSHTVNEKFFQSYKTTVATVTSNSHIQIPNLN